MKTAWNGEYISPYAEHGKKSEQVKKITVSIPLKVLKILTDERTRRQKDCPDDIPLAVQQLMAEMGKPIEKYDE